MKFISAIDETGVESEEKSSEENLSVLAGPSGVGKSSLTNCIQPRAAMETGIATRLSGSIPPATSQLFYVEENTYMMDTPIQFHVHPRSGKKGTEGLFPEFAQ